MGKTQKVSKGRLSHFVPDYRHAFQTMTHRERTEGLVRVDTEMTPSEDSLAQKRRCVSLNGDNNDSFGVPIQVFQVSQMSYSERKALKCRLKKEHQHIQILQQRLAAMGSNVLPSPVSDIHGLGDGISRHAFENLSRPINGVTMPKGKKKPSQGRNAARTKGAGARCPKSPKPATSTPVSMLMKQCENLLQMLMSHTSASIFNEPVDIVKSNIPDYFTIVKQPMDLGTVKIKLLSAQYSDPLGFAADTRLTFSNAMTYNPRGNAVHIMAKKLSKFFEVRWKQIEKKLSMMVDFPLSSKSSSNIEGETATSKPLIKENKVGNVDHEVKQNSVKRVMTCEEKNKLRAQMEEVASDLPNDIVDYLMRITNHSSESNVPELEIDLELLTNETLFTLRDVFNDYLSNKQKSEGKVEPCEIELGNESGFSNFSMQPCKGNDLADEDVDIGGNDAPISTFPPLEIEKDGVCHNNTHCSSSSSSSGSFSSSSESDTGSASHGDSDGRGEVNQEKETGRSGECLEQEGSYVGVTVTDILNGDAQPNSVRDFDSGSSIACQEGGGNAPLERQVSPGNNYRAAFLRERFADTILKAQAKALETDAKMEPDRLRFEREELKRKEKEDKARLLAEARAAEVAQRKVEAKAAAEVKRKRELEREAAREALQKMEKTVYMNQNTLFLEDLEILKSAPEQSLLGEISPDGDQNGLGSFNLHSSNNPLELLGLYMKDDNDEEDDIKNVPDDAEEGEISF